MILVNNVTSNELAVAVQDANNSLEDILEVEGISLVNIPSGVQKLQVPSQEETIAEYGKRHGDSLVDCL